MNIFSTVLACTMVFLPISIQEICAQEPKVSLVESIQIDNEWYVALICEPIYTLSERAELCQNLSQKITKQTGVRANVIIDSGLYFDIKYAKSEPDESKELLKRIKTYFLRRNYEYHRNN